MDELFIPSVASELRKALTDPKRKFEVMKILGWDNTQANKYLAGKMGIVEGKLDRVSEALRVRSVKSDELSQLAPVISIGLKSLAASFEGGGMEMPMKKAG